MRPGVKFDTFRWHSVIFMEMALDYFTEMAPVSLGAEYYRDNAIIVRSGVCFTELEKISDEIFAKIGKNLPSRNRSFQKEKKKERKQDHQNYTIQ